MTLWVALLSAGVLTVLAAVGYFTVYTNNDGCDSDIRSPFRSPDVQWPPGEDMSGIEFSFEVMSGETAQMRFTQRNVTDETISFATGGGNPNFFIVAASSCELVWIRYKTVLLGIFFHELGPYEERMWSAEWERVTQLGAPVDPGEYLVYAKYGFVVDGGQPTFLSSPHKLEVE